MMFDSGLETPTIDLLTHWLGFHHGEGLSALRVADLRDTIQLKLSPQVR
jgi:hypothetical protein